MIYCFRLFGYPNYASIYLILIVKLSGNTLDNKGGGKLDERCYMTEGIYYKIPTLG